MTEENLWIAGLIIFIICVAIGIYAICAAIFNWNWFFNSSNAELPVSIFGRNGARIFYAICGMLFIGIGITMFILI